MLKLILTLSLLLIPSLSFAEKQVINLNTLNTVNFRGPVDHHSVALVMMRLTTLIHKRGSSSYPIYLVMDSPGGDIEAGMVFIDYLSTLRGVHTINLFSASMAAGIMQANPGKRYVTPTSVIMFHRASGQFRGQFEEGEVESQLELWKKIVRDMEQRNADRIGISLPEYKKKVVNEWWVYGPEAVSQNVADANVSVTCSKALVNAIEVTNFMKFSRCPLFRVETRD